MSQEWNLLSYRSYDPRDQIIKRTNYKFIIIESSSRRPKCSPQLAQIFLDSWSMIISLVNLAGFPSTNWFPADYPIPWDDRLLCQTKYLMDDEWQKS